MRCREMFDRSRLLLAVLCVAACFPRSLGAQTSAAESFERLDINEDGVLSGLEAKGVAARDADGDGKVTRAEYEKASSPNEGSSIDPVKLFAQRDITEDGFLSGKEVKGFEKFDADQDGQVTKQEFLRGFASKSKSKSEPVPDITSPSAALMRAEAQRAAAASALRSADSARAEQMFRVADGNEDDRLSGSELRPVYKAFDTDQDGRVTKAEFVAGMLKPTSSDAGAAVPKNVPTDEPSTLPKYIGVLVSAFQTGDVKPLFAEINERGKSEIDELVVQFLVDTFRSEYGEITMPGKNDLVVEADLELKGERLRETVVDATFAQGKAKLRTGTVDGRIEALQIRAPLADDINEKLSALLLTENGKPTALRFGEFYGPKGKRFIELLIAEKDQEAFALFYPEVQKQLGFEKVQAYFKRNRLAMGEVKSVEWNGVISRLDDQGKPRPNFQIEYDIEAEKTPVTATITFQIVGLKAHITSFSMKAAK
ncbi:MAG: EF-hand domain-containing protein [Planctomycetia bacterium]|nr:EF-hand domain-containing protein [Planctomycetia bacterium]